jgi:hypothetical protein
MPSKKENRAAFIGFLFLIVLVGAIPMGIYLYHRADRTAARLEDAKDVSGLLELHRDYQQRHKNPSRLVLMVRALGNLGDRRAIGPLAAALEDPKTPRNVRAASVEALGKIKDPDTLSVLFKAFKDPEDEVRLSAEAAIVNFGPAAIEPLLGQLVVWDSNPGAARALEKLGWTPVTDEDRAHYLLGLRDSKTLRENQDLIRRVLGVDDPDWQKQPLLHYPDDYALQALVSLGHPEDIPYLVMMLQTEKIAEVYVNSGNTALERAAREWAAKNGYEIKRSTAGTSVPWGSLR